MNEFEMGKCADCPLLTHITQLLRLAENRIQIVKENAMNEEIDKVVAPRAYEQLVAESMDETKLDGELLDSPQKIAAAMRKEAAQEIDIVEQYSSERKEVAERLAFQCEGPLKMRAVKAGRQITATICNSPSLPLGESTEEVQAFRKLV